MVLRQQCNFVRLLSVTYIYIYIWRGYVGSSLSGTPVKSANFD